MLPLENKMKSSAGIDVAALNYMYALNRSQPCFLHETCRRTAHNQTQSVEQQRRHGPASVNESHVPGGPLRLAAGSTRMLPPL